MEYIANLIPNIQHGLMSREFNMKPRGKYLREGICPSCGQKSLWTWFDTPLRLQCERENNCGIHYSAKELLPDLFERINETYQPTPEDPNNTANAYLSLIRGFDLNKIQGWYGQEKFWKANADRGTATVRFFLNPEKTIWFDRFIDDVTLTDQDGKKIKRNKDFHGSYSGLWWQPPTLDIVENSEVIFTEGILDAIALNINGYPAVSIMSAGTFPSESIKPYLKKGITWVLGLDSDKAGLVNIEKHAKTLRDMGEKVRALVQSEDGEKCDWNDCHQQKKLTEANIKKYRLYGDILLADSKEDKAFATFLLNDEKIKHFVIDFKRSMYAVKINLEKYTEEDVCNVGKPEDFIKSKRVAFKSAVKINRIAEFTLDYLYHQQPENGSDGQYVFRVNFANFAPSKELLVPNLAFGSAAKFIDACLSVSGAMFEGESKDVRYIYKLWTHNWKKVVRTLDYIGYDKESKTYVFNEIAIRNGQVIKQNKEGFFSLEKQGIKTIVNNGQELSLTPAKDFYLDYELAYGIVGLFGLTWTVGSLFAEQIAEKHSSYPFFELSGRKGGTGKSHLVETLFKLQGREYTPFNPVNSTTSARMREPSIVSNSIFCCNEAENEDDSHRVHSKKFTWNDWKDFFERKGVRTINTKNQTTINPPFRGSLLIVQNVTVNADTPFLQRICHQTLTADHHTVEGRHADMRLMGYKKTDLSNWLITVLKQENTLLKRFFERYDYHNARLQKCQTLLKTQRIIHNHSQMLALADCLHLVVPISHDKQRDLITHIENMAVEREKDLERDHPIIEQFWQTVEDINGLTKNWKTGKFELAAGTLNHAAEGGTKVSDNGKGVLIDIAININHFYQEVFQRKMQFNVDSKELKRILLTSTSPSFIDSNVCMHSAIENKPIRCWVFKYKK